MKNNKKKLVVLICLLLVIISLIIFLIFKLQNKEETLENRLANIASAFYEKIFYSNIISISDEKTEKLEPFKEIGLKIKLTTLEKNTYTEMDVKKELEEFKKRNCDFDNTGAVIKPKEPYEKTDYEIMVELDCE